MDNKAIAAKIARLRERANDKSLPQDVRNTMLDEAVKLEQEAAKRAGVRLAKGGMAKKELPKRGSRTAKNMAMGGMAKMSSMGYAKGGMAKMSPMGYAKGGMVKANCGASVPASKGKK